LLLAQEGAGAASVLPQPGEVGAQRLIGGERHAHGERRLEEAAVARAGDAGADEAAAAEGIVLGVTDGEVLQVLVDAGEDQALAADELADADRAAVDRVQGAAAARILERVEPFEVIGEEERRRLLDGDGELVGPPLAAAAQGEVGVDDEGEPADAVDGLAQLALVVALPLLQPRLGDDDARRRRAPLPGDGDLLDEEARALLGAEPCRERSADTAESEEGAEEDGRQRPAPAGWGRGCRGGRERRARWHGGRASSDDRAALRCAASRALSRASRVPRRPRLGRRRPSRSHDGVCGRAAGRAGRPGPPQEWLENRTHRAQTQTPGEPAAHPRRVAERARCEP
jgi:hypothetical protein